MKLIKNPIKVDFSKRVIVVSRPFSLRAGCPSSAEYFQLAEVQRSFPDYKIVVRTIKKGNNEHYKGLTYAYMEYYISTHADAELRMEEYKEMRLRAACHSMKYAHIKKWFLDVYPQIDDFTPEDYRRKFGLDNVDESEATEDDEKVAA